MKYCIRCGRKETRVLCDRCLEAAQDYIQEYDALSAAGIPMGVGELNNRNRDADDVKEALERRQHEAIVQP